MLQRRKRLKKIAGRKELRKIIKCAVKRRERSVSTDILGGKRKEKRGLEIIDLSA